MSAPDAFDALLHARHSCRAFLPKAVARETLDQIIRSAGRVPSWCNAQPWHVTLCSAAATDRFRAALHAQAQTGASRPDIAFPASYTGLHKDRRRTCGFQLYDAVGIEKGDRAASGAQMMENFNLFGAPHVAIITAPKELGPYGLLDCGAFITALTLAAQARGIASIPQAAVAAHAPFVRAHFDLPGDRDVVCAVSLGYADTDAPVNRFRTERAAQSEIMTWSET